MAIMAKMGINSYSMGMNHQYEPLIMAKMAN
jgi:hypothetical protein